MIFFAIVLFLIKPFLTTILASLVLAYIFYPVYKLVKKVVKNSTFASLLVSILIVLLFTLPLIFVANAVSAEARVNYVFIKKILATGNILEEGCNDNGIVCSISDFFGEYLTDPQIKFQITNMASKATDFFLGLASNFILSIPVFLLKFFIMVFIIFYLFKQGDGLVFRLKRLLPLKKVHSKSIFDQLSDVTYAVIYGHILVSGIQALLGMAALWAFGVSSPILWGFVMFFFALIPFMGTPIVWVPAVLYKAFSNHPMQALGLLISGLFISIIDNFIKPKIVSGKANVHPVLVLLGVIGGFSVFGLIGIILGPVILSIFMTFIQIYEEEEVETQS